MSDSFNIDDIVNFKAKIINELNLSNYVENEFYIIDNLKRLTDSIILTPEEALHLSFLKER